MLRSTALVLGLALVLLVSGCSPAGVALQVLDRNATWLCRPGAARNPCGYSLATTSVTASGSRHRASMPSSALADKFDCFYVYPTVSNENARNTGISVTTGEIAAAVGLGAPFSDVCDVWSPLYRSQTWPTVEKGLAGDQPLMRSTFTVAYDSVLTAWRTFLAHDDHGRPIILLGDSQGAAILIHLISTEIDHQPSQLRRLLVAILIGGNLQVPQGKTVGSTFTGVPLCTSAGQTGCAIAFSSYPSQPPADSFFGRPGQGVSLQSGQTAKAGEQVACVNPAALAGGSGSLDSYFLTTTQTGLEPKPSTPWVTYPDLYSAQCEQGGGATWLQITSHAGQSHARPLVSTKARGGATGPAWGYHDGEAGLTMGNLLSDVTIQERSWESHQ